MECGADDVDGGLGAGEFGVGASADVADAEARAALESGEVEGADESGAFDAGFDFAAAEVEDAGGGAVDFVVVGDDRGVAAEAFAVDADAAGGS